MFFRKKTTYIKEIAHSLKQRRFTPEEVKSLLLNGYQVDGDRRYATRDGHRVKPTSKHQPYY
jgi:hypothetical protein